MREESRSYTVTYLDGKNWTPVSNNNIECYEHEKEQKLSEYLDANNVPEIVRWTFKLVESQKVN